MLLEIKEFSCEFHQKTVLKALNLTLQAGEVVAILGSNGAGKSTLLKCILGLQDEKATLQGTIEIFGHPIHQKSALARSHLAYVPEQPAVYGHLSAIENIQYFLSLSNKTPAKKTEIEACLSSVGLAQESWHQACGQYSKGMRQKVMLALALAKQAKLLLLDEPNSGLDPNATEELNQIIMQCKQLGMGILVVTHDVISAMTFSDRILMLTSGELKPVNLDQAHLTLNDLKQLY